MIGNASVLAIVPARGGSKGVPGKNILPVAGRPLIHWTIDAALKSRFIDRVVLSSDDEAIIAAARTAGCEVPFRRDASLAQDDSTTIDVVLDALNRLPGYDIVVVLQPTSPLRTADDIDRTLEALAAADAPACVTVSEANDHPYWTFRLADGTPTLEAYATPENGMPLRRQDLPKAWCLNGAVYAARTEWFVTSKRFLAPRTVAHAMPVDRSIDIDTAADVERLKAFLAAHPSALAAPIPKIPTEAQR